MCTLLNVHISSYFSWTQSSHAAKENRIKVEQDLVQNAFFFLKENAGTRVIKGYLFLEQNICMSRRKIGKIMKELGLKLKRKQAYKNKSSAAINDPKIQPNKLDRKCQCCLPQSIMGRRYYRNKNRARKAVLSGVY